MEKPQVSPLNKTLEYLHQMRGSLLPIEAVAYSHQRGHILTVDASALRLWSLRKELSVLPRAPRSAPPVSLLRLESLDVFALVLSGCEPDPFKVLDSPSSTAEGSCSPMVDQGLVKILGSSMATIADFKPFPAGVEPTAACLHRQSNTIVTAGSDGEVRFWYVQRVYDHTAYAARNGDDESIGNNSQLTTGSIERQQGGGTNSSLEVVRGHKLIIDEVGLSISILEVDDEAGLLFAVAGSVVWVWRLHPSAPHESPSNELARQSQNERASASLSGVLKSAKSKHDEPRNSNPASTMNNLSSPPQLLGRFDVFGSSGETMFGGPATTSDITALAYMRPNAVVVGLTSGEVKVWHIPLEDGAEGHSALPSLQDSNTTENLLLPSAKRVPVLRFTGIGHGAGQPIKSFRIGSSVGHGGACAHNSWLCTANFFSIGSDMRVRHYIIQPAPSDGKLEAAEAREKEIATKMDGDKVSESISEPGNATKGRELALRLLCSYKLEAKAHTTKAPKRKDVGSQDASDFQGIIGTPTQSMVLTNVSLPSFGRRDALLCVNGGVLSIFEVLSPVWPFGDREVVAPHGTVVAMARGSAALTVPSLTHVAPQMEEYRARNTEKEHVDVDLVSTVSAASLAIDANEARARNRQRRLMVLTDPGMVTALAPGSGAAMFISPPLPLDLFQSTAGFAQNQNKRHVDAMTAAKTGPGPGGFTNRGGAGVSRKRPRMGRAALVGGSIFAEQPSAALSLTWLDASKLVVVGKADGSIEVIDTTLPGPSSNATQFVKIEMNKKRRRVLLAPKPEAPAIGALAAVPGSTYLVVSGDSDGRLALWDAAPKSRESSLNSYDKGPLWATKTGEGHSGDIKSIVMAVVAGPTFHPVDRWQQHESTSGSRGGSSVGNTKICFTTPPQAGAKSVLVVTAGGSAGVIKIWRLDPGARSLILEHQFIARNGAVTSLAAVSSAMPEELSFRQPNKKSMALVNRSDGLLDDTGEDVSGTVFSHQGVKGVAPRTLAQLANTESIDNDDATEMSATYSSKRSTLREIAQKNGLTGTVVVGFDSGAIEAHSGLLRPKLSGSKRIPFPSTVTLARHHVQQITALDTMSSLSMDWDAPLLVSASLDRSLAIWRVGLFPIRSDRGRARDSSLEGSPSQSSRSTFDPFEAISSHDVIQPLQILRRISLASPPLCLQLLQFDTSVVAAVAFAGGEYNDVPLAQITLNDDPSISRITHSTGGTSPESAIFAAIRAVQSADLLIAQEQKADDDTISTGCNISRNEEEIIEQNMRSPNRALTPEAMMSPVNAPSSKGSVTTGDNRKVTPVSNAAQRPVPSQPSTRPPIGTPPGTHRISREQQASAKSQPKVQPPVIHVTLPSSSSTDGSVISFGPGARKQSPPYTAGSGPSVGGAGDTPPMTANSDRRATSSRQTPPIAAEPAQKNHHIVGSMAALRPTSKSRLPPAHLPSAGQMGSPPRWEEHASSGLLWAEGSGEVLSGKHEAVGVSKVGREGEHFISSIEQGLQEQLERERQSQLNGPAGAGIQSMKDIEGDALHMDVLEWYVDQQYTTSGSKNSSYDVPLLDVPSNYRGEGPKPNGLVVGTSDTAKWAQAVAAQVAIGADRPALFAAHSIGVGRDKFKIIKTNNGDSDGLPKLQALQNETNPGFYMKKLKADAQMARKSSRSAISISGSVVSGPSESGFISETADSGSVTAEPTSKNIDEASSKSVGVLGQHLRGRELARSLRDWWRLRRSGGRCAVPGNDVLAAVVDAVGVPGPEFVISFELFSIAAGLLAMVMGEKKLSEALKFVGNKQPNVIRGESSVSGGSIGESPPPSHSTEQHQFMKQQMKVEMGLGSLINANNQSMLDQGSQSRIDDLTYNVESLEEPSVETADLQLTQKSSHSIPQATLKRSARNINEKLPEADSKEDIPHHEIITSEQQRPHGQTVKKFSDMLNIKTRVEYNAVGERQYVAQYVDVREKARAASIESQMSIAEESIRRAQEGGDAYAEEEAKRQRASIDRSIERSSQQLTFDGAIRANSIPRASIPPSIVKPKRRYEKARQADSVPDAFLAVWLKPYDGLDPWRTLLYKGQLKKTREDIAAQIDMDDEDKEVSGETMPTEINRTIETVRLLFAKKSREDAEDERCLLTVGAGPSLEGQGETQSFFAPRSATLTPPTNIMVGNSDEQNSVADTLASAATESSFARSVYNFFVRRYGVRELAQHKLVSLFDAVSDAPQVPQLRLFARFLKIETRNDRDGAPTLLNLRPQRLPGSAIQFYIEARKWLREHRFIVDGPLIPRKLLNTMAMAAYDEWDGWGNDPDDGAFFESRATNARGYGSNKSEFSREKVWGSLHAYRDVVDPNAPEAPISGFEGNHRKPGYVRWELVSRLHACTCVNELLSTVGNAPPVVVARVLERLVSLPPGIAADYDVDEQHSQIRPYQAAGANEHNDFGLDENGRALSPHSSDPDKDPNAAMRSNNSEHDDISVGWEGVGMDSEDSDGDKYKGNDEPEGMSAASYSVQLGPDGSAMTMTNPNELVDVDLFLEIILEELADADARVKNAADTLFSGPDHEGRQLTPRETRALRLEDPAAYESKAAARLENWAHEARYLQEFLHRCLQAAAAATGESGGGRSRSGMLDTSRMETVLRSGVCGWGKWPKPDTRKAAPPQDLDREENIKELVTLFQDRDVHDSREACYLDIWAFLYVESTTSVDGKLPMLEQVPMLARLQAVGIDGTRRDALLEYHRNVTVAPAGPVPAHAATAIDLPPVKVRPTPSWSSQFVSVGGGATVGALVAHNGGFGGTLPAAQAAGQTMSMESFSLYNGFVEAFDLSNEMAGKEHGKRDGLSASLARISGTGSNYVLPTAGLLHFDTRPASLEPGTLTVSKACFTDRSVSSADAIQRIVPASLDATSMGELLEASRLSASGSALGPPPRQTVAQKPAPLHHHPRVGLTKLSQSDLGESIDIDTPPPSTAKLQKMFTEIEQKDGAMLVLRASASAPGLGSKRSKKLARSGTAGSAFALKPVDRSGSSRGGNVNTSTKRSRNTVDRFQANVNIQANELKASYVTSTNENSNGFMNDPRDNLSMASRSMNDVGMTGSSVASHGTYLSSSMGSRLLMRFPGVAPKRQVFQLAGSRESGTSFGGRPPPMLHPDVIKMVRGGGYTALHGKYDRAGRPVSPLHWKGGLDGGDQPEGKQVVQDMYLTPAEQRKKKLDEQKAARTAAMMRKAGEDAMAAQLAAEKKTAEEAALMAAMAAEKAKERAEAEARAREAAEKKRKEEEAKARALEEERLRKLEEERQKKLEAERKARKEAEEKARKEAERQAALEEERRRQAEREARVAAEREREAEERRRKAEAAAAKAAAKAEEERLKREALEAKRRAEQEKRDEAANRKQMGIEEREMKLFLRDERKWLKEQARLEAERIERERLEAIRQAELARLAAIAAEEAREREEMGGAEQEHYGPKGFIMVWKIEDAGEEVKKQEGRERKKMAEIEEECRQFYVDEAEWIAEQARIAAEREAAMGEHEKREREEAAARKLAEEFTLIRVAKKWETKGLKKKGKKKVKANKAGKDSTKLDETKVLEGATEKKHKDNHKGRHSSTFHIAEGDETHAAYFDHDGENSQSGDSDDGSDEDFPTNFSPAPVDITNIRLGAAYSYTGFEQEMAFSQNISYDPFAIGQNRAVYGSLDEATESVASLDSARSSLLSESDEEPEKIIKDATNKKISRNDLDFLYNTSDREDTSYKDWPPMFMTTKVLWDQYMEDELEVMFANLKMKLQIEQPEDVREDGTQSVHTTNTTLSPDRQSVRTARSVDHSLDPRRAMKGDALSLVDETTDTVVALRSRQLTRDGITGTEVGQLADGIESAEKPRIVDIDPLPFGLMCHGRVPWGETRYFQIEVTDPTAILTVTLLVTTPTTEAIAEYEDEKKGSNDRATNGDTAPRSAIGNARPGPALLLPITGTGEAKPSADVSAVEQAAAVAAATATGDKRAVWNTQEVSRRRPAGLAKADLLVAKSSVPTLLDYHWKSADIGPRDRIVIYPKEPRGGGGTYIVAVHAPPFQQLVDRVCEARGDLHRAPKPNIVLSPRSRRRVAQEKEEAAIAAKAAGLPVPVDKEEGLLFGGGAAPSDGPSFAICCNQSGSELTTSASMKRIGPAISRLSRLGDQDVGDLLGNFSGTAKHVDEQILGEQPKEATVEGDEEARAEAATKMAEHTAAAAAAEAEQSRIEEAAKKAAAEAEADSDDEYDQVAAAERREQIYEATKKRLAMEAIEKREQEEADPWNIPRSAVKDIPMEEMVAFDDLLARIGMRAMKSEEFLNNPLNAEHVKDKLNNPREPALMGGSMRDPHFERMPESRPFPALVHGHGQPMPSKWLMEDSADYGGNYSGEFDPEQMSNNITKHGISANNNMFETKSITAAELDEYDHEMNIWRPFARIPPNRHSTKQSDADDEFSIDSSAARSEATSKAARKSQKLQQLQQSRKLFPPSPQVMTYQLEQVELRRNRSKLTRSPSPFVSKSAGSSKAKVEQPP